MKQYRFETTIKVAGRLHKAGSIVPADQIPSGSLEAMLRQRQVAEHNPSDPAEQFAALMAGAKPGQLLTLPDGVNIVRPGPTEDDMRAAVGEINRLCGSLDGSLKQLAATVVERDAALARVKELEAKVASGPAPPATEQPKPPEPKADEKPVEPEPPVEAKAKAPVIGPTKPPELKAHGKK